MIKWSFPLQFSVFDLNSTGCPKKMVIMSGFEFLTFKGVFFGVKNNAKNFLFYNIFWFV